jgi:predicted nucleic acid-binding Zn ribbon protein
MNESAIKMGWEDFVGKEVAKHTTPSFLKKGVLFIHVDSPVWAYELSTHLKDILSKKINEGIGKEVVKDIHFKVGGKNGKSFL